MGIFLYFVLPAGIRNTTASNGGKREIEMSFISTPAKENISLHD